MFKTTVISTIIRDTDNIIIRDVAVSSAIVELGDRELAIIDTGMAGNPQLIEQLGEFGYAPADFTLVINTHLHQDHIGGNSLFTRARIVISRQELQYEQYRAESLGENPNSASKGAMTKPGYDPYIRKVMQDIKRLRREYPIQSLLGDDAQLEYFEDLPHLPGSITVLSVPGHSIDSRAIMVQGDKRRLAAVGDALYHRDLWPREVMPYIHYDPDLFLVQARQLATLPDIIVPGHDQPFDNRNGQYLPDQQFEI